MYVAIALYTHQSLVCIQVYTLYTLYVYMHAIMRVAAGIIII